MSTKKIGGNTTNILNCYFFCTLDWISTCGKVNFLPTKSTYLIFFSLRMQRRLMQTKVYHEPFYSVWKETSYKALKKAAAKRCKSGVYVIDPICFEECFLFHVISGKHYFLYKFIVTQRLCAIAMLLFWKKSVFYIHHLHNNITMLLIRKVQNKTSTS